MWCSNLVIFFLFLPCSCLKPSLNRPPDPSSFPAYTPLEKFRFEIVHQSAKSGARVGRIHTPHGIIDTPGFVPVGTNGAMKAISNEQSAACGTQLMFCNTYHLLVHPGPEVLAAAGGLHRFMGREQSPLITDSGGFQVFSLATPTSEDSQELKRRSANKRKNNEGLLMSVKEKGVVFRSYHNGAKIELTPESSVQAQKAIGADIIVPLDELPPLNISSERLLRSLALSHRWMARSLLEHLANRGQQAMYGIIHGGVNRTLRKRSVDYLTSLPFDGYAVGGSLGKDREEMLDLLSYVVPLLPKDKPNHILGIADPESIVRAIPFGCDTFDSCFPTHIARHGTLMTREGLIHITQGKYRSQFERIEPSLPPIEGEPTRAYLHHLFKAKEALALTLASMHNVRYMNHLMASIRSQILADEI